MIIAQDLLWVLNIMQRGSVVGLELLSTYLKLKDRLQVSSRRWNMRYVRGNIVQVTDVCVRLLCGNEYWGSRLPLRPKSGL